MLMIKKIINLFIIYILGKLDSIIWYKLIICIFVDLKFCIRYYDDRDLKLRDIYYKNMVMLLLR